MKNVIAPVTKETGLSVSYLQRSGAVRFVSSSLKRVRPSARNDAHRAMRMLAARGTTRKLLNLAYGSLSWDTKAYWHSEFAKLFRLSTSNVAEGRWEVVFEKKKIVLPVGGPEMWLCWDSALSLLGHEIEIKRVYAAFLRSSYRPKLFLDVGANYGLHSLLFLVHGIPTISFEPNRTCRPYIDRIADMNGVHFDLRQEALGDREGSVDLWFPKTDTWFGTTVPEAKDQIVSKGALETETVPQKTLDSFVAETSLNPDLIKIDTEGNELDIIRGGRHTLRQCQPAIIFESWRHNNREDLFDLLAGLNYSVFRLLQNQAFPVAAEDRLSFCDAPENNFLALPRESSSKLINELFAGID